MLALDEESKKASEIWQMESPSSGNLELGLGSPELWTLPLPSPGDSVAARRVGMGAGEEQLGLQECPLSATLIGPPRCSQPTSQPCGPSCSSAPSASWPGPWLPGPLSEFGRDEFWGPSGLWKPMERETPALCMACLLALALLAWRQPSETLRLREAGPTRSRLQGVFCQSMGRAGGSLCLHVGRAPPTTCFHVVLIQGSGATESTKRSSSSTDCALPCIEGGIGCQTGKLRVREAKGFSKLSIT